MLTWLTATLRGFITRRRAVFEADDELQFHVEQETAANIARGLSAAEARRVALRDLGGLTQTREAVRDVRATWMDTAWQDLRHAARLMRRSPAFTLTAVVVLSLGIGVNVALFSVVSSLFFRPLSVKAPEQLFYLYDVNLSGQVTDMMEASRFERFREATRGLADFTAHKAWTGAVSIGKDTETRTGSRVAVNYFDVLGVPMTLGRGFRKEDEDRADPDLPIVISHLLWTRAFHSRADVLGQVIRVNDQFFSVIGVAPQDFNGLTGPFDTSQYWIPGVRVSGSRWIGGPVGRLRAGVRLAQVKAAVAAVTPDVLDDTWDRLTPELRQRFADWRRLTTFPVYAASDVAIPSNPAATVVPVNVLVALVVVAGLVLLIAVTNIAGLLLARGMSRRGEVAVRQALGARPGRLARQMVTESVLLSSVAGLAGAALAAALVQTFVAWSPATMVGHVSVDARTLLFVTAVCIGTGIVVGLAPALQAIKVNVIAAITSGIVDLPRSRTGIRPWIVGLQVTCALSLVVVAATHIRGLTRVELTDRGYRTAESVVVTVGLWGPNRTGQRMTADERRAQTEDDAATRRTFNRGVLDRVAGVPGLAGFALATSLPLRSHLADQQRLIERDGTPSGVDFRGTRIAVSRGYFDVMGMRLLRGRGFEDRDAPLGHRVAIISETLARRMRPGGDVIGRSIAFAQDNAARPPEWLEVIGVVNDVAPVLHDVAERPDVYVALEQEWRADAYFLVVRGVGDRAQLLREVRDAVAGAHVYAEVTRIQAMQQIVAELLYPRRAAAMILSVAGGVGLILACIGLYGVVAYAAAQRQRELGIRSTLGASRGDLIGLVMKEGVHVIALGTIAGLALAGVALRFSAKVMPAVPAFDWVAFVLAPAVMSAIALMAGFLPARRATRIDPARVLRGE